MLQYLKSLFIFKISNYDLISKLVFFRKFMFTKENQQLMCYESSDEDDIIDEESTVDQDEEELGDEESKEIEEQPKPEPIEVEEIYTPTQMDSLFWSIYIIKYGYNDYMQIQRNYGVRELEIKKEIGKFISENPNKMKSTNTKMTKVAVQEILSELLTSQKETTMNCLMGLLVFADINIFILNSTKSLRLEYISNTDVSLPTYVLYKDTYNKYKVNTKPLTQEEINALKETTVCLENYMKPLKSAASYKVTELENIARTLGIYDENKKYKKTDLYEEVCEACKWT